MADRLKPENKEAIKKIRKLEKEVAQKHNFKKYHNYYFPENIVKTKTTIPIPRLLINSDSMYTLTQGCNLGTKIIVIIMAKTHFINEIKLNEKPFKKH